MRAPLSHGLAALMLSATLAGGAVEARPKIYPAEKAGALATRCSARYGEPLYAPAIPPGGRALMVGVSTARTPARA